MPYLDFKGKEFVRNHHLSVPYRPLVPDTKKSVGKSRLDGNLIIHGDNLHALKSLIPMYAGRVNCIYIDPPYNTGNEGWCYNDNVNSAQHQAWLNQNPVGIEDGLRHDKWCTMMYPRLFLLHELLAEDGVIFISIDENEQHRLTLIMEEIFGVNNHIATLVWAGRGGKGGTNKGFAQNHEYIVCFAKDFEQAKIKPSISVLERGNYKDELGEYRREQLRQWGQGDRRVDRPAMFFPVQAPDGTDVYPKRPDGSDGRWRYGGPRVRAMLESGDLDFVKQDSEWAVYRKIRKGQERISAMDTLLLNFGTASTGTLEIKQIFDNKKFDTVKPKALVRHLIDLVCWNQKNAVVLDSFAGSGTTAHATLALNKEDGGNRKFILVECEDYADTVTAERIRRVIKGVPNTKDKDLKAGLGGDFTYCELGQATDIDKLLSGQVLPSFKALGTILFHTATNEAIDVSKIDQKTGYLGESSRYHLWLIYKPDLKYLKSNEAALTLDKAQEIADAKGGDKRHLVFAPAVFVSTQDFGFYEHPGRLSAPTVGAV